MSIYGELDPILEHRTTHFVFKGNRENKAKVNIPNVAYPNQHADIEKPCCCSSYCKNYI